MGNIARVRIANRAGAALFLRIHADGSTDSASAPKPEPKKVTTDQALVVR